MIITPAAAQRFLQITKDDLVPRIEIVAGGCNGFEKKFSLDNPKADDIIVSLPNGAIVLVDNTSNEFLFDSIVDYEIDLSGNKFTITIPSATSTCGCGSSFAI